MSNRKIKNAVERAAAQFGAAVERANRITAYSVLAMVMVGALISWIAFLWRHA